MTPVKYTAPACWASYLLNGDASGLDDKEQAQADRFIEWVDLGWPVDCGEPGFRHSCDAPGVCLAGDMCEYTFLETERPEDRQFITSEED